MIKFLQDGNGKFSWNSISNISNRRNNLGDEMPVFMYRLFQYTLRDELIARFGKEVTIDIFRKSGERAGCEFVPNILDLALPFNEFFAQLQEVLQEKKIGILRIEKFDSSTGHIVLTISEDLDCSGLPVVGETVCNYDEGLLAGILKSYTKKSYQVVEVDCWSTGSRVCRFEGFLINEKE